MYTCVTCITVDCLGCFTCTSINYNNPECEDPFNNTGTFWDGDCWAARKERKGNFPATQCIKMIAEDRDTGHTIVARTCVVDNGDTNSETEIGRLSHCGWMRTIKYGHKRMRGCILACDTDGCNSATRLGAPISDVLAVGFFSLAVAWTLRV
ncbi:hypothetical protein C0Q70_09023 [Pomacea canaliculata]|uniref:Protein quiver n=1 Tax=Pomacea canaliculata TaxID=400727 RepID=A0A2T7P8N3_POMCA|nr:hypothetical protein C0Q70_09023 [Pomacea canaliculata]